MSTETVVRITGDAEGFVASMDRARKSAADFVTSQDTLRQRLTTSAAAIDRTRKALKEQGDEAVAAFNKSARSAESWLSALQKQASQAGKTRAELMELRAAELGVSDAAAPYISKIKDAESALKKGEHAAHGFSMATAGARRELMVMGHELATGNFKRFFGSTMVFAERTDLTKTLMSPKVLMPAGFVAAIAAAAGITYKAREALAAYGETIENLHEKTGVSTKAIQEWAFATKTVGIDAKDATKELAGLGEAQNKALNGNKDAGKAFAALGISLGALKGHNVEQLLPKIADAFHNSADSAAKAAVANELFGASGEDLIPLLNRGSAALADLRDAAQQYGGVIDGQTLAKMAALKEQMELSKAKMDAMAMSAKTLLLPTILNLTDAMAGNVEMKPLLEDFYKGVGFIMKAAASAIATVVIGFEQTAEVIATVATVAYYASTLQFKMAVDSAKAGYENLKREGKGYSDFMKRLWTDTAPGEMMGPPSSAMRRKDIHFAKGGAAEKAYKDDAATRMLEQLREQAAELRSQLSTTNKLTEAEKELAKFNQEIVDWKGKKLTAEQQSLVAHQDEIRAQLQTNIELEKEVKHREDVEKLLERSTQLHATIASYQRGQQEQYGRQLDAFGMGTEAEKRVQAAKTIYAEYQRLQEQLDKATPKDLIGSAEYLKASADIKAGLEKSLQDYDAYYDALKEKQTDWTNGAATAFANYIDSAKNTAAQAQDVFTNAFKGIEDVLTEFAETGRLNFKKLADSIFADITRIVSHRLTGQLFDGLSSMGGGMFGGFFSSHPNGAATTASALPGNALENLMKLTKGFGTATGAMNVAQIQTAMQQATSLSAANATVATMTVGTLIGGGGVGGGSGGGALGALLGSLGSSGDFAGAFGFSAASVTGSTGAVMGGAMASADTSGLSALMGLGGGFMASGGYTSGKAPYIVGETGPELFVPSGSGTVIPNHALRTAGAANDPQMSGGPSQTFNLDISVPAGTTRQSAQQQAAEIMRHAQIAMARNG